MVMSAETLMQFLTLALAIASAVISILILIKLKNENTEVSWRFLIASAVVFAIAQVFTILESWKVSWAEKILIYEPEVAYLLFSILFLLGISRHHQVARNSEFD